MVLEDVQRKDFLLKLLISIKNPSSRDPNHTTRVGRRGEGETPGTCRTYTHIWYYMYRYSYNCIDKTVLISKTYGNGNV
jgi:hypothetical protein